MPVPGPAHRGPDTGRPPATGARAPATVAVPTRDQRRAAKRLQARKVGRLVRHIDPWSVLKMSLLLNLCLFVVLLVAGTALWTVARASGTIEGIEGFVKEAFALTSFAFDGGRVFQVATFGGLALVIVGSAVASLSAVVFNLVSDLVGGIRLTVVEEETARPVRDHR